MSQATDQTRQLQNFIGGEPRRRGRPHDDRRRPLDRGGVRAPRRCPGPRTSTPPGAAAEAFTTWRGPPRPSASWRCCGIADAVEARADEFVAVECAEHRQAAAR